MSHSLLYLDTNILIYLLEGHETYSKTIAGVLEEFTRKEGQLITSAITVTEFHAGTVSSDTDILRKVPKLNIISLDYDLAEQAAVLQRKNHIQIGDAIHLATAIRHVGSFFTNDKQLAKVAEIYVEVKRLNNTIG